MLNKSGGWIKRLYDNQEEYGFDDLIKSKKASWSKGKQSNIESVILFNKNSCIRYRLSVPNTEWYQFDRFCNIFNSSGDPIIKRMARVVQAKIQVEHIAMNLKKHKTKTTDNKIEYFFFLESLKPGLEGDSILTQQAVGKWLSLILLPDNSHAVELSERGKVAWQEVHI
jgi:hypothetical protein